MGDVNENQTRNTLAQIDSQAKDRRALAASGWAGTVATVGAGLADPLLYVPIVGDFAAAGVAGNAAMPAIQGAVGSAASEATLHATQVDRPWQDSAYNVASTTILAGALGGAWGMLSPAEQAVQARALDGVRPRMTPDGSVAPIGVRGTQTGQPFEGRAFHGTNQEFTELDPLRLGANTGAPSAHEAFFFSKSPETANTYLNSGELIPFPHQSDFRM